MPSKALLKARKFEKKYLPFTKEEQPWFHVTGGIGWINDPNGFSPYKGEYHLFFQYYPYDTKWGPMHWGHVKTKDFIKWERLPCAMAPDTEYDRDGCFSGGAVEMADGRHLLIYTGVSTKRNQNGKIEAFQTQCIAIGDGVDYEKYELNPVIGADLIPEKGSVHDFRDPKIWREGDTYYVVVGNRGEDGSGNILMYESDDAINWKYDGIVSSSHNQYGRMWECPDFFELDGKDVLFTSPQEMTAIGLEFHPGNANVCIIGKFDRNTHHLNRESVQAVDYGLDFYAMQTLQTYDGRRVMIGWMQNWETSSSKNEDLQFCGMMTIPRELSIRNGRLCQNPVREIEQYRGLKIDYYNVHISNETSLYGINGNCIDMTVTIKPGNEDHMYKWFRIYLGKDGEHYTFVRYRPDISTIKVDRTRCGFPHDIVNIREFPVRLIDGNLKIRFIIDRYSMEMFVNDGEQAASFILYTPINAEAISFYCEGSSVIDIEKYDLLKGE